MKTNYILKIENDNNYTLEFYRVINNNGCYFKNNIHTIDTETKSIDTIFKIIKEINEIYNHEIKFEIIKETKV